MKYGQGIKTEAWDLLQAAHNLSDYLRAVGVDALERDQVMHLVHILNERYVSLAEVLDRLDQIEVQ